MKLKRVPNEDVEKKRDPKFKKRKMVDYNSQFITVL